jgi:Xaa-Pro aminopeptidase
VLAEAWVEIGARVRRDGGTDEFAMVQWLRESIAREGLFTDHGPNVSAGPNSADPHYDPSPESSRAIRMGDFVLIDIWAKLAGDTSAIWYDITWTGVVGREPTEREQQIFHTVRGARDAAIAAVERAFAENKPIAGWEADEAARSVIREAGFGEFFTHRTGHNIATELHGSGAHLDNLETHDERLILPDTCFSVEPGIYFPGEFGVRSEVNMIARVGSAAVTGPMQRELVRL